MVNIFKRSKNRLNVLKTQTSFTFKVIFEKKNKGRPQNMYVQLSERMNELT